LARLAGDGRLTRARDQHAPAGPGVIITYRSHAQEAAAVVAAAAELGATAAALRLDTAEVAAFDQLVGVHFRGVYFLTQQLLPLLADGGRIINLSSGLARFTQGGCSAGLRLSPASRA
jgi:NAD(P)-dependent dehydrogenase (short-subunit alcohol dehydrogenase family)